MSKRNLDGRIKLTSYDDMFDNAETETSGHNVQKTEGQIVELELDKMLEFKGHPFRVTEDEKMQETTDSIRQYGVLVPGIVRPTDENGQKGMFEILSGHRRCYASRLAGKVTMPVIIRECTNDEAILIMVDSNIQREDILPSEKARAYHMKFTALKHQGSVGGSTLEKMGQASGETAKTIQRYIRLSYLTEELLQCVDEKKLGIAQGVELSYLQKKDQDEVSRQIMIFGKTVTLDQALYMKELHNKNELDKSRIFEIFGTKKPEVRKVSFSAKKLDSYFAPEYNSRDIEDLIIKLLNEWKEKGGEL